MSGGTITDDTIRAPYDYPPGATELEKWQDLAYVAWTVIANAGYNQGGWDTQDPEWVGAAIRWRDNFHRML